MSSLNRQRKQWERHAAALRTASATKPIDDVTGFTARENPKQPIETLYLSNGMEVHYPTKREPYVKLVDGKKVSLTTAVKNRLIVE